MRPALSLKTLLRSPFRTLLTFLLLAAASFALFSRVTDYAITARETDRARGFYRGTGSLIADPESYFESDPSWSAFSRGWSNARWSSQPPTLPGEQMDALASLPQVTSTDRRYMTAGVSGVYKRLFEPSDTAYNYTTRFVMTGTYKGIAPDGGGGDLYLRLIFDDCALLTGDKRVSDQIITPKGQAFLFVLKEDGIFFSFSGTAARQFYYVAGNQFGQSFADSLTEGERLLIIGRYDPGDRWQFLGDQDSLNALPSVWKLDGLPGNYLETEDFAPVRTMIELINSDLHTFDMVYTSDMGSIPRFFEKKTAIAEGRALMPGDTDACVVNRKFLTQNLLAVGDKITVGLGGKLFEQNSVLGALAVIPQRYAPPVKTVELTIVGAYLDVDSPRDRSSASRYTGYSQNTIFVPASLLPAEPPADHTFLPAEYSFIVADARQIDAFLAEAEPLAENSGFILRFDDAGWSISGRTLESGTSASLATAALFIGAGLAALLLAVYLFIGRGRKTYAIMRALGTPRGKARNSFLLSFGTLCALAVPAGAAAGLIFTARSVSPTLSGFAETVEGYIPDASAPAWAITVCGLAIPAALALFCLLFIWRLAKKPPLALLQGDVVRVRVAGTEAAQSGNIVFLRTPNAVPAPSPAVSAPPARGGYNAVRHVTRYILRHIRRAGTKTAICVLLAALMCGAMGAMSLTRFVYAELFDNIEVKGHVTDLSVSAAQIEVPDAVKDLYYYGGYSALAYTEPGDISMDFPLVVTNDIGRYLNNETVAEPETNGGCVLDQQAAETLGLKPGDRFMLISEESYKALMAIDFENNLNMGSAEYTVSQIIPAGSHNAAPGIYAPAGFRTTKAFKSQFGPFTFDYCEFTLADNGMEAEAREYAEKLVAESRRVSIYAACVIDTAELENAARMTELLSVLFPVAVAAALLIGLFSPILAITQSAGEAAILRVLGTTKRRVRCMLAFEQVSLCVLGLALAVTGLSLYNPGQFAGSAYTFALCAGLYIAGCVCAVILAAVSVTRRKVLVLLQVKE